MKTESDDESLNNATGLNRFDSLFDEALKKMGTDFSCAEALVKVMRTAGFQNVSLIVHKAPLSDWSKDPAMKRIATLASKLYELETGIIVQRCFQPLLDLSEDEANTVAADAIRDMRNTNFHGYKPM